MPKETAAQHDIKIIFSEDLNMSDNVYFENAYFIIGTAYAGKSTMVKELAKRHDGTADAPGNLQPGKAGIC